MKRHPDESFSELLTLIYIEDIYDRSRSDIIIDAKEAGMNPDEARDLLREANETMDNLRRTIRDIVQAGDYDEQLKSKGEHFSISWRKWTPEEQARASSS